MHAHYSYVSNNFKRTIAENTTVLHCDLYGYEECLDEIVDVWLSEPFSTRRMKKFGRPDGFMLYEKLGVEFLSTFGLLYPNIKRSRARPDFYILATTPSLVLELLIARFTLVLMLYRMIVTRNDLTFWHEDPWRTTTRKL